MRRTFTKLIAASVILVNSQVAFAKKGPNYLGDFTNKMTKEIDQYYIPRALTVENQETGEHEWVSKFAAASASFLELINLVKF